MKISKFLLFILLICIACPSQATELEPDRLFIGSREYAFYSVPLEYLDSLTRLRLHDRIDSLVLQCNESEVFSEVAIGNIRDNYDYASWELKDGLLCLKDIRKEVIMADGKGVEAIFGKELFADVLAGHMHGDDIVADWFSKENVRVGDYLSERIEYHHLGFSSRWGKEAFISFSDGKYGEVEHVDHCVSGDIPFRSAVFQKEFPYKKYRKYMDKDSSLYFIINNLEFSRKGELKKYNLKYTDWSVFAPDLPERAVVRMIRDVRRIIDSHQWCVYSIDGEYSLGCSTSIYIRCSGYFE